jgi:hypothetical protein
MHRGQEVLYSPAGGEGGALIPWLNILIVKKPVRHAPYSSLAYYCSPSYR